MEHADRSLPDPPPIQLPDPPPIQRGGRDLLRFAATHLVFLGACFAIGETVFLLLRQSSDYEIGLGREFPTLEAAETALSVAIARAWGPSESSPCWSFWWFGYGSAHSAGSGFRWRWFHTWAHCSSRVLPLGCSSTEMPAVVG